MRSGLSGQSCTSYMNSFGPTNATFNKISLYQARARYGLHILYTILYIIYGIPYSTYHILYTIIHIPYKKYTAYHISYLLYLVLSHDYFFVAVYHNTLNLIYPAVVCYVFGVLTIYFVFQFSVYS